VWGRQGCKGARGETASDFDLETLETGKAKYSRTRVQATIKDVLAQCQFFEVCARLEQANKIRHLGALLFGKFEFTEELVARVGEADDDGSRDRSGSEDGQHGS
jgi:hypothetical protein